MANLSQSNPVRGTLLKRGVNIDPGSTNCLGNIESIEHLFSECHIVKKVWELVARH